MKKHVAILSIVALVALCLPGGVRADKIGVQLFDSDGTNRGVATGLKSDGTWSITSGTGTIAVTGSDGNDTEINRLATVVKASSSSPAAGTTGTFTGVVTGLSFVSTMPDGNHSTQVYNTTANPTCASNPDMKGAFASVGSTPVAQLCNGTDWLSLLTSGGALGTPASGTLTNCNGLPVAGIAASTSTALGVGSIELGHASDTTVARSAAGAITVEGNQVILAGSTTITKYQYLPSGWMVDAAASPCAANAAISGEETMARLCDDNESVIVHWQVDPEWTAGVKFRVYYALVSDASADNTVSWRVQGCSVGNSEALTCSAGDLVSVDDELGTDDDANQVMISDWSASVTLTGIAAGEFARITLRRGTDDYAAEVNLLGIELKYQAKVSAASDY